MRAFDQEKLPLNAGPFTLAPMNGEYASATAREAAGSDPWKRLGYGEKALHAYLTRADPSLFRASVLSRGKLMGALCVREPWLKGPYLEFIVVFEGFRGQGAGSQLVEWFDRTASGAWGRSWIMVSEFNNGARRLYERAGYVEAARFPGLTAEGLTELLLVKSS